MDLQDVKGVGPSAASKLRAAGIDTVERLAQIDLRAARVAGLSSENVARLRTNARCLLRACNGDGDLTLVEGLGASAANKLRAAGVDSIEDLVELDLRRHDVEGLSTENVQRLKRNARFLVVDT